MAISNEQFAPIQLAGAWTTGQKHQLREVLNNLPAVGLVPTAAPVAFTNSTGGSPSNTLAVIPVTAPADLAAQGAVNTTIRNSITSLAAKVNEIRTALVTAGILT